MEIVFRDGEHLLGLTLHQPVADEFFFLPPAGPQANNQRALINRAAVAEIREIGVGAAGG
ncbi:MAG TPA: hypothetical protein VMN37_00845 [Gemmatimonadales bacterium]|nr:hypothetical protein [Gemmatimonadales bacterium]